MSSKGPRLLPSQRESALLLERARVFVSEKRVIYSQVEDTQEKHFNIPHANLAVLFLGQGTSMTVEAARMLAEEGVYVAFTGSGGTPLHYGALTVYQVPERMRRMFRVHDDPDASLAAARLIMRARTDAVCGFCVDLAEDFGLSIGRTSLQAAAKGFLGRIETASSSAELMGMEGTFAKQLYGLFARAAKIDDFSRQPRAGDAKTKEGRANAHIDHGNYLAYGIAGAALWALGMPAGLSVLHGKTRAGGLVFDLADSFKDALILPLAFSDHEDDSSFKHEVIKAIYDFELLKRAFETADRMLEEGERVLREKASS